MAKYRCDTCKNKKHDFGKTVLCDTIDPKLRWGHMMEVRKIRRKCPWYEKDDSFKHGQE